MCHNRILISIQIVEVAKYFDYELKYESDFMSILIDIVLYINLYFKTLFFFQI